MKRLNLLYSFLLFVLLLFSPLNKLNAKPNDITLNRLVYDSSNPQTRPTDCSLQGVNCEPNQQEFRNLMREFGYAISPMKLLPAETYGFGGGYFGVMGHITFISNDENYWEYGVQEKNPPKALFLFQATSQFIFIPYFLEWGFTVGYLFTTSDSTIGFNVKLSPFEGFRKKALGALP
ncbi:MAG: hypothetical protein NC907_06320, partial [Candidatus Omnitrophica bacterium]|nr:hypothetical protein [Candidatus Omnitrophota bacterium]